ncbi:MAG: hypothetical protein DI537_32855 [Stutzerimonas stutzeri]|nr:MAG: hypothetical protein DI537_32855 [Stutzerimonas stutzeri]
MLKASMYFAYGRDARAGLSSKTTFQAILAGERTSTTRFAAWPGSDRYRALKVGDKIRFFEDRDMRGRHVDVVVTELPRDIDLARCSADELVKWSQCEGWSEAAGRGYGRRYGVGLQIRFKAEA